jgi:hypothetical protein
LEPVISAPPDLEISSEPSWAASQPESVMLETSQLTTESPS